MGTPKKMAAGMLAGLVISVASAPAWAQTPDIGHRLGEEPNGPAEISYQRLTWQVASRLPSDLKVPDVAGVSPTVDNLPLRKEARSLLIEAANRIKRNGDFSDLREKAEWDDGIKAYTAGDYLEAIAHFHAELER